jgi:hypothetical protein
VKSQEELFAKPLHQYNVNISHGNDLSVKSLEQFKKEQTKAPTTSSTPDPEYYEEYDDEEDYGGLILTEEERLIREQSTSTTPKIPVTSSTTVTTTSTTTQATLTTPESTKLDDHTVILTDNFYLPKKDPEPQDDDEGEIIEYIEYIEDDDEEEPGKTTQNTITSENSKETTSKEKKVPDDYESKKDKGFIGEAVVSVVTSKTVVNGTIMDNQLKDREYEESPEEISENQEESYDDLPAPTSEKATTERSFSVQTSRSVSHSTHEERQNSESSFETQTTVSTETDNVSSEIYDDESRENYSTSEEAVTTSTTTKNVPLQSTESIIDKLDRVQSELSLGILSGEYPVLQETASSTANPTILTSTSILEEESTTSKPFVLIRKFSPKSATTRTTTTKVPFKLPTRNTQEIPIAQTQTSESLTTAAQIPETTTEPKKETNKKQVVEVENDELDALLPPGYKASFSYKNKKITTTTEKSEVEEKSNDLKDGIKFDRNSTGRSFKTQINSQDVAGGNKFKKFNKNDENDTKKLAKIVDDSVDINKFLPPGYKEEQPAADKALPVIPLQIDDIGKFLPPGYKKDLDTTTKKEVTDDIGKLLPPGFKLPTKTPEVKISSDISALLPPGYKPPAEAAKTDITSIFDKIQVKDISNLLPPGFKAETGEAVVPSSTSTTTEKADTGLKGVVFPARFDKKPRLTTAVPKRPKGPPPPQIQIHKGPPTRATTEFTGWPTVSTTPFSIEKYLEMQKEKGAVQIDISDILGGLVASSTSSTTTSTSSTTSTTTSTPKPTQPTICRSECSLAATIRIIQGIEWTNELLNENTNEWKIAAQKVEKELNNVYSKSDELKKWYKKVTIDSFSKGSVLVDYFVELSDLQSEVNTLEIRKMFHDALVPAPSGNSSESGGKDVDPSAMPQTKEAFMLGSLVVDPISTDFIGEIFSKLFL